MILLRLNRTSYNLIFWISVVLFQVQHVSALATAHRASSTGRERVSLNANWKFHRTEKNPDNIVYDVRADTPPNAFILKPWILPSANDFIKDPAKRYPVPTGKPTGNITFAQTNFDDSSWDAVNLPHDFAIKGPFYAGDNVPVKGGMGRLPVQGVAWYRRNIKIDSEDTKKSIYLDIDGAMSYAIVWLNGNLVGGWPYGYNSFRLDLTPFIAPGDNRLAIRLDNPTESSRWYPGGGLYRNVWLSKEQPLHIAHWGTYVTSKDVSSTSAIVDIVVNVENKLNSSQEVDVTTNIHELDSSSGLVGALVSGFQPTQLILSGRGTKQVTGSVTVKNPRLWGPYPSQKQHQYVAVTRVSANNQTLDTYETPFGIRSITFDGNKGVSVNGEHVRVQGVNQHHDLGAIGAAWNLRAATRQLEVLRDLGCNAIRMSHNPPAPELLDLTDKMGFLVIDEIFDMWVRNKTTSDAHLIFPEWHEADLRNFLRRDRNHPSIISWSFGNEVGEQYTDTAGAELAQSLHDIVREEDPTRPSTASMNYAKPNMPFPKVLDVLSVNYQGEGIRDAPAYAHLSGTKTPPIYPDFHKAFPEKVLWASESAASLSTRGTYIFPVTDGISAPVNDTSGGNSKSALVSAYELYSADFGSSPDKVFATQDRNPYVAGEFVWSGWDYLGEPTPYYSARSSYFGIIDLAGFKKDRFFLYQARWRPDYKMAHILPHWTWPDRIGKITPIHVFSAADEAELFLNGKSQGRKKKAEFEYRFRWDEVKYQPGELRVVTYKNGTEWATDTKKTASKATQLRVSADRKAISKDGLDLTFITVEVLDDEGNVVPEANDTITFNVGGVGELVATDNGDPRDLTAFPSKERKAFSGLALAIVKAKNEQSGPITLTASAGGLKSAQISIEAQ